MTKPIVASALMMLFEEGEFLLEDPISNYIPEFRNVEVFIKEEDGNLITTKSEREITILDLFTHTSGLSYGFFPDDPVDKLYNQRLSYEKIKSLTLEEVINLIPPIPLRFQPGEYFNYSWGIDVLGRLIEVLSGQKLDHFLQERFFKPLEMVDTAKKLDRILGVNYNYHYMAGIRKIKEIIVQQALGKLAFLNINVHAFSYAHALDLLSFFGGNISSVSAYYKNDNNIRKFGGTDWNKYDDDILYVPSIAASVSVEFANGTIGVLNSSYYYNLHAFVLSVEAIFEDGVVSLNGINMFDTIGELTYCPPNRIRKVYMNYKRGVYSKGYEYTFYESIRDFMECYVAKEPVPTSGAQALFNMKLERIIAQSNANHKKIRLQEFGI